MDRRPPLLPAKVPARLRLLNALFLRRVSNCEAFLAAVALSVGGCSLCNACEGTWLIELMPGTP